MRLDKNTKILIVGLGLIGGSYAKALTKQGYHVSAITRSQSSIDYALEEGIIEKGAANIDPKLIAEANLIVFSLYPKILLQWVEDNQKYFSPTFKPIIWTIEAKTNSNILWYVGDKQADPTAITFINTSGILGVSKFEFVPEKVGNYVISCEIDGSKISYRDSIKLSGIKPTQLDMSIVKIENRNTYTITVDFGKYYDVNKLIWYKTKDTLSDEFDEEIGRGTLLEKTFTSDCKIVVMYMEDNNDANPIISESIVITVDKYVNTETIIAILVVACIVALIVLSVIAYKKRYNDYY